jgi:hypothetical protein
VEHEPDTGLDLRGGGLERRIALLVGLPLQRRMGAPGIRAVSSPPYSAMAVVRGMPIATINTSAHT